MMIALAWKDFREQRTIWIAMLVLNLVAVAGLPLMESLRGDQMGAAEEFMFAGGLMTAIIASGIYGLVCGAMLLAGEREAGTMAFVDGLAGRRVSVWWIKLLTGLALTLCLGLVGGVAAAVYVPSTLNLWTAERLLWALPAIALDAFLWGLLGSALCRSVMAAVMSGAACLTVTWIITGPMIADSGTAGIGIVMRMAFGVAALSISAWVFCRRDLSRGPRSTAMPASRFVLVRGSWRAMLWLIYRQVRWEVLVLGIVAGVLSVFVPADYLGVWALASLFLGVIAGTGVFSAEQRGGYQRFLADQRLPLGRIWWFKTLTGGVTLAFLGLLLMAATLIMSARFAWERSSTGPFGHESDSLMMLIRICGLGLLLAAWPALGFGIGQFCGLVFRKGVVAVVFALIAAAGVVLVWTPSLLAGGLTWWQMLGVPVILLAGTRLVAWDWAVERLQSARPALVLVGCVVLAILWSGGVFAYRAIEIPDVGEPFDVAEFEASLRKYERSKAKDYIANACRRIHAATAEADTAIGAPATPVFPPTDGSPLEFPQTAAGKVYMQYVNKIYMGAAAYPMDSVELNRWLDRVFADEWARDLKTGLAEPPGLMLDPRRTVELYSPTLDQVFQGLPLVRPLMQVRAYQLLARGDHAAALDQIVELLAFARFECRNPGVHRLHGRAAESTALTVLERWLAEVGHQPELVRRALEAVQAHEREMPSAEETMKAEYLIARNRLEHPTEAFIESMMGRESERHPQLKARMHLLGWSLQTPWEKERARRMLIAVYAGRLEGLRESYPAALMRINSERGEFTHGAGMLYDWVPPKPLSMQPHAFAYAVNHSWFHVFGLGEMLRMIHNEAAAACRLGAAELQAALMLYELEQGKVAGSLCELVPRYLPALPSDPFSGAGFRYRVSSGESILWRPFHASEPDAQISIPAGEGILWSAGPDCQDGGGQARGNDHAYAPRDPRTLPFDWIFRVPRAAKKP